MPNSWKELVPRKKEIEHINLERCDNPTYDEGEEYNQCIADHQPLYEYVEKLERALDEIASLNLEDNLVDRVVDIARKARGEER